MDKLEIAISVFDCLKMHNENLTSIGIKNYKEFTNQIKILLGNLGESKGYEVATNCKKDFSEKEWLFDIVWYKMLNNQSENIISSIDLVLETEISYKFFGAFKTDFDKLLLAGNSTKIMIFTKIKEKLLNKIEIYIQKSLDYSLDFSLGSQIHLILWDENDTGDFSLTSFSKKVI